MHFFRAFVELPTIYCSQLTPSHFSIFRVFRTDGEFARLFLRSRKTPDIYSVEKTRGCPPSKELNDIKCGRYRRKGFPRKRRKKMGGKTEKHPTSKPVLPTTSSGIRFVLSYGSTVCKKKGPTGISRRSVAVVLRTEDINSRGVLGTRNT